MSSHGQALPKPMAATTSTEKKSRRAELILLVVVLMLALPYNTVFWRYLFDVANPAGLRGVFFLASVAGLLSAFFFLVLALLPFRYAGRIFLSLLLPLTALTGYFMNQYGVAIDNHMMQNVFETDLNESLDLVTWKMGAYVVFLGILPVVLLWRQDVAPATSLLSALKWRAASLLLALCVLLLAVGLNYQSLASVARNHKEIRYYLLPNNFIGGIAGYFKDVHREPTQLQAIGTDVRKGPSWVGRQRKTLVVLVIGETARAQNFSLNGYARPTNPELAREPDVIALPNFTSCGTETAVSLPCMLSDLGRSEYSLAKAAQQENLLDVVQRAGVKVQWVENQSGCKRTCDRVGRESTTALNEPAWCQKGECFDGILQEKLQDYLQAGPEDSLVVLHQMGSHGPAYYKRYPAAFEHFTPACHDSQLDKCTHEEIVNAYDNTLRYTDHVLAGLVDTLRSHADHYDTALIYLSDHGESLGEYGLYLHGAPYMLAPPQQTHIPAVVWLSPSLQRARGVNAACFAHRRTQDYSQDNLFHSVLGLLDLQTKVYNRALDMFSPCTAAQAHAAS